ncbi:sugar transferase [Acetomicrobium sp.]|uniref:sugar transferase n=1 Tax=Acetomicrobium sp. TaxID=1872099 RepID=UPI0028726F88|nr:sugar transferase [Acetomicrobium sp.]MDR9768917.1 sugar transferase [Acetomicrobium sp.]
MYEKYIKGLLDFLFAILLLVILSPIMLAAAIIIKMEDPGGPILFKQERVGKDNKIFTLYKFRTMIVETEKNGVKLSDADRLLKFGNTLRKLSIDELPQLFNIIKGEMSFIGPRPLPVVYLPYYTDEELHRHDVRPGVSGWAQVNGRNYLSWEEKFRYDLEYVNNVSFLI